ncbi:Uncharacterised protein [Serratia quinivorans]|nr:Uncharacterised protein [Serratia quinivorans]CAI1954180.1 Uncharacterised protein [Serratia quinivorans]
MATAVIQLAGVGDGQLLVSQNVATTVAQRAGVQHHRLAFQPFIFRLSGVVGELQSVERDAGTAADQPQGVIDNSLSTVQQQVADRLNLSVAVIQTGAGEGYRLLADNPSAVAVVQFQRRQGEIAFGSQRAALVIEIATAELQLPQTVQGAVLVIQQLAMGVDLHIRARLHQPPLITQATGGVELQCLLRHQFTTAVQQRFGVELETFTGNHHALAVVEHAGSEVHGTLAGNTAFIATVVIGQSIDCQFQPITALDQTDIVVIQAVTVQLQHRLGRQLAALVLQQTEVDLRRVGANQGALVIHQMVAIQLQFFTCANHPKIAVIQQFFGVQHHFLTGFNCSALVVEDVDRSR